MVQYAVVMTGTFGATVIERYNDHSRFPIYRRIADFDDRHQALEYAKGLQAEAEKKEGDTA